MAKKHKPHDPARAMLASMERRDREAEVARMKEQGATVTTDRTGRIVSAYRSNVFNLLLSRGTISQSHHDAATRLANEWAQWKGLAGQREISAGRVDDAISVARALVTDRMLRAGDNVGDALHAVSPRDRAVLTAFMIATVEEDRPMAWRGLVERETEITRRPHQVEIVLSALEALRLHYEAPRTQDRVAA